MGDLLLDQLRLARMLRHPMHQLARDDLLFLAEVVLRQPVELPVGIAAARRRGLRRPTLTLLVRLRTVLLQWIDALAVTRLALHSFNNHK